MMRLKANKKDLFSSLKASSPETYVRLFMNEYLSIIATPLNISLLHLTLLLSLFNAYKKTASMHLIVLGIFLLLISIGAYTLIHKNRSLAKGSLSFVLGFIYIVMNSTRISAYTGLSATFEIQSALIVLQFLIPIVFSIISIIPFFAVNLALNFLVLSFYYLYFRQSYHNMGIQIDPYVWQVWVLSSVITMVLHFMIHSRALSKLQKEEIERSAETVRNIFDSINQAVFLIRSEPLTGKLFVKEGVRSPHCQSILGFPHGEDSCNFEAHFLAHTDTGPIPKEEMKEALSAVFGGTDLTWELNDEKFPRSVHFHLPDASSPRHLTLSYVPIYDKGGEITEILMTALDDTELLIAEAERLGQKEKMNLIVEMIGTGRDKIQKGMALIMMLIDQAARILHDFRMSPRKSSAAAFIPMHTAKGNARTLGLKTLAHEIHEVEDVLNRLRGVLEHTEAESMGEALESGIRLLQARIGLYRDAMETLGWSADASDTVTLPVSSWKAAAAYAGWCGMREAVDEGRDPTGEIAGFLSPAFRRAPDIGTIMTAAARRAATALGKETPQVACRLDGLWLTSEAMEEIAGIVPHIAGNILDHGIEEGADRLAKGKTPGGNISVFKTFHDGATGIAFSDDGRGLDLERLRKKGMTKGFLKADQDYRDEELAALIFEDGLSTRDGATELSGRGVGMVAVRAGIERLGGGVRIELYEGTAEGFKRFAIVLELPGRVIWS